MITTLISLIKLIILIQFLMAVSFFVGLWFGHTSLRNKHEDDDDDDDDDDAHECMR